MWVKLHSQCINAQCLGWKRGSRIPLKRADSNCSTGLGWNLLQLKVGCLLFHGPNQAFFHLFLCSNFCHGSAQAIPELWFRCLRCPQSSPSHPCWGRAHLPTWNVGEVGWTGHLQCPFQVHFWDQAQRGFVSGLKWEQTAQTGGQNGLGPAQLSSAAKGRCAGRAAAPCASSLAHPGLSQPWPCPWQLCAAPLALSSLVLSSSRQQQIARNHQENPSVSLGQCFLLCHGVLLHKWY